MDGLKANRESADWFHSLNFADATVICIYEMNTSGRLLGHIYGCKVSESPCLDLGAEKSVVGKQRRTIESREGDSPQTKMKR